MKLQVFSIKDRALDAFMRPWYAQTIGQAIRMFQDELNNNSGEMYKHPDDYDLYHIATWDDHDASFTKVETTKVSDGKQLKNA